MSFENFVIQAKAALALAGLTETPDPREDSLTSTSRGGADGSYLLSLESAEPWPEQAKLVPTEYKGILRVEILTALTTSVIAQGEAVAERARQFFEKVVYAELSDGSIYAWEEPRVIRNFKDKRIVWQIRCSIRWSV
jgi:hypothetical protein